MRSLATDGVPAEGLRRRADVLGQRLPPLFQGGHGLRVNRTRGCHGLPQLNRATNHPGPTHTAIAHSSVTEIRPQNAIWFLIFRASGDGWR